MPWVRLDDQFPHHPKVVGVGPLGIAMQVAGLCYCSQFLTDGFVPSSAVVTLMDFSELDEQAFNGRGNVCWIAVEKLVVTGIWEPVEGGYQIHDYLLYQPSREQVLKDRAQARVRMNNRRSSEEVRANNPRSSDAPIPIPIPIPIEKEDTPNGVSKKVLTKEQEKLFNVFWQEYPRKTAKTKAVAAWKKLQPSGTLCEEMLAALAQHKQTPQWGGGFIPHASTWLNGRRWEDEITTERSANGRERRGEQFYGDSFDPLSLEEYREEERRIAAANPPRGVLPNVP